jgi:hypothetical protein
MWEPTLFGSFTGLVLLLVLFRLASAPSRRLWAVFAAHVVAIVLSFSAAGIFAVAAGWLVFLIASALGGDARRRRRALAITTVAALAVGAFALSPDVRQRLAVTLSKVVTVGAEVPASRLEREESLTLYFSDVVPAIDGDGIGIGQLDRVGDVQVPLPLRVWAELGVAGLALLAALCLAVCWHVWVRGCEGGETSATAAALLAALTVVLLAQGGSKINFVFFFGGLLLALPGLEARPPVKGAADGRALDGDRAPGRECGF